MNKADAITAWMAEHHPEAKVTNRHGGTSSSDGWVVISMPSCEDTIIEVDFYDDCDKFYAYPDAISGHIKSVYAFFQCKIADPTYFDKLEALLQYASTLGLEPPILNGKPLWTLR